MTDPLQHTFNPSGGACPNSLYAIGTCDCFAGNSNNAINGPLTGFAIYNNDGTQTPAGAGWIDSMDI